jgi:TonB family protein
LLTADIPMGDPGVLGAGERNPLMAGYYSQVFSRLYAAWNQPSQLKNLPGLKTEVCIVVEPGGKIVERMKSRGSGNELMDDSVMKAVRSVQELPPLPRGYWKPQEIIVTFVLGE